MGVKEHEGSGSPARGIEECKDEVSSQGEDEVDKMPMPPGAAPTRCGMQVAILLRAESQDWIGYLEYS